MTAALAAEAATRYWAATLAAECAYFAAEARTSGDAERDAWLGSLEVIAQAGPQGWPDYLCQSPLSDFSGDLRDPALCCG